MGGLGTLVFAYLTLHLWSASPRNRLDLICFTLLMGLVTRTAYRRSRVGRVPPIEEGQSGLRLPVSCRSARTALVPFDAFEVCLLMGKKPKRSLSLATAGTAYSYSEGRVSGDFEEAFERVQDLLDQRQQPEALRRRRARTEFEQSLFATPARGTLFLTGWLFLVFAVQLFSGSFENLAELVRLGGHQPTLVNQGEWQLLLSGTFLHLDPGHFVANLIGFLVFGHRLELLLATPRYLTVVLTSSLAGALSTHAFSTFSVGVGFSGAVFGILGGLFALQWRYPERVPVLLWLKRKWWIFIILIEVAVALWVPGINAVAHGGGFLAGALVTLWLTRVGEGLVTVSCALLVTLNLGSVARTAWDNFVEPERWTARVHQGLVQDPLTPAIEVNNMAWKVAIDPQSPTEELEIYYRAMHRVLQPENGYLQGTLALLSYRLNRTEEAVQRCRTALLVEPELGSLEATFLCRYVHATQPLAREGPFLRLPAVAVGPATFYVKVLEPSGQLRGVLRITRKLGDETAVAVPDLAPGTRFELLLALEGVLDAEVPQGIWRLDFWGASPKALAVPLN